MIQGDLFKEAGIASFAPRPPKPDSALLLRMSDDHRQGGATEPTKPASPPLPRTGAELIAQARSCCGRCSQTGHPHDYTWHKDTKELLCPPCNAGKLGYRATPNKHGVYLEPTERLALPRNKKGWQGVDTAEIELIDLGPHWLWSTGYELSSFSGSHSPLSDHHATRAPTRAEALSAACDHLRRKLEGTDHADARAILAWLKTLDQDALLV
ncbi:MAG: hypothetical protein CL802_13545 [Citromicrobium sp.]|nr:hypothetical protein [Citromicrobium sp.]|tara:strand:- start:252 stop:884 length:633 start_codon:yes stop_codon:yes gene_type:complete